MQVVRRNWPILIILLFIVSCDNYQQVKKSNDMEWKYQKALEYYNNEEYYKAVPLFEELISVYKGTKNVQDIYYYYAYSQFEQDQYLVAAYHYNNLYDAFPNGQFAEDCAYMTGFSYYKMSPRVSLEQKYTHKAIDNFKRYLRNYPNSDRSKKVKSLIEQMRVKLEQKSFNAAMLYFEMEKYIAAKETFTNFIENFPDSEKTVRAQFLILKSNYLIAKNSVESKKKQRYNQVIDSYYAFIDKHPNNAYTDDAEKFFQNSRNQLEKISQSNEQRKAY